MDARNPDSVFSVDDGIEARAPVWKRVFRVILIILLVAGSLGAGLWLGRSDLVLPSTVAALLGGQSEKQAAQPAPTGPIVYYRDPSGKPIYSAEPRQTEDGRDFVPVRQSEDVSFEPEQAKNEPTSGAERRVLYYRNPMGLPDTSPVPKKDWMGMDYIPVYEGEEEAGSTVKVSLDKVQRAGVRTEPVTKRLVHRPIRAPGIAKPDERSLYVVALRADSFIEKLHVNETGRHVKKGEPLFHIYSPEMVRVQVDYRVSTGGPGAREERGALQRLRNLQIPEAVVEELKQLREPVISFDWPSPVSGVVLRRKVIEGMMVRTGEELMTIGDISRIWVIADVAEQDLAEVRVGSKAKVHFKAFPNEPFEGRVTFILHELEMATRTAKVRIEIANPDHRIRHEMFADVTIEAGAETDDALAVPVSALIDSGNRQVVLVDRGEGRFEPRPVRIGRRNDTHVEIVEGLTAGETVVIAATFLLDAESNLKAALSAFTAERPATSEPATAGSLENASAGASTHEPNSEAQQ